MTTTIGARIKSLREQRRLSQEDVAEKFGFNDRQTLSAIETGDRKVAADELLRAVQIFGVPIDYLTDPFMLAGEGRFSWRQTGVDGDGLRGYEESAGRLIAAFRTLARQTGHKPPLMRPALSLSKQSSYNDASAAGERFAAEFDLGDVPARRLADAMEKLGILVLMVDPIDGVSGAACRLPELDVVLINRNEIPGRRHFDLAHELFHILTWEKMPPEHIEEAMPKRRNRVEQLADNFASALLMPGAVLDRFGEWGGLTDEKLVDRLNEVADEMLVTSQALRWRLVGMKRLSRELSNAISGDDLRNNGRTKPGKPETPPLFSKPFVQIVAAALDEGQTSMRRIASILGLAIDDFADLFAAHGVEAPYEL
ncbi:XRE family transcriptional regulator [Rhizobium redzepovicii]|uniref:XRE family transcriptional regulator n=1 Tax=Rhizobium redzepovicii TaxID=2867518 RepID=UPI001C934D67|nr:XRE family transcriptional regulator [Rhizobium redzepovicii]MBY4617748.1 XRE family transcriptional regulator [Rhizobium redzepovicii]